MSVLPADPRAHLLATLHADLVGPFDAGDPTELLELPPSRWYLTGFLAPIAARDHEDPNADDDIQTRVEDDDDESESAAEPQAKQRNLFPASMGLSVLLPPADITETLEATVSFAEYTIEEIEPEEPGKRAKRHWRRAPRGPFAITVRLDPEALDAGFDVPGVDGIWLGGKLGIADSVAPGTRALSLFLVNRREPGEKGRVDEQFVFQVQLALASPRGFVPRANQADQLADDWDRRLADLQFRDRAEWAVGHNVSVDVPPQDGPIRRLCTTWIPRHEVRSIVTREHDTVDTRMEALSAVPDGERARAILLPLVDAYRAWITQQRALDMGPTAGATAGTADARIRRADTRDELMRRAEAACDRMRAGIDLLATEPDIFEAFRLANRAMAMSARQRSPDRYTDGREPRWRLFQLAFVLQSLRGLHDPAHADRDIVDLIYFPTGGGKTEAYLGVIAATLVLRRLRGIARLDGGLGVAVLLRYTLRLLTLDQLGRAATLVCALEVIRKERPETLGDVRFAVGLWVGRSATANTMAQVKDKITEYKNSSSKNAPSPFPLTRCPWCGQELDRGSFELKPTLKDPQSVVVGCLRRTCAFSPSTNREGIPVLFVDEQIYAELPSFVVATVDKFAMLPWRGETGMLFGRVTSRVGGRFFGPGERNPKGATLLPSGLRPPELIVQDELHLISGPLGTMVGLYETAIDWLATYRTTDGAPVRPKVIASTATVRRAQQQIQSLFGRDRMQLFPPQGVDDSETWFATVARDKPGRLYVGVAASGQSLKGILLRAYVDLLTAASRVYDTKGPPDQLADAYMTVVGYFNSLRELGGMRRLVEDDVRGRSSKIEKRVPLSHTGPHPWSRNRPVQAEPVELTSREPTAKIAEAKARLEKRFADKDHVDVVLASNMISVGVDIDRLGVMVVAGQPKTTSEYIQASSRVGRQSPGFVVTCFNLARPRDRSHYERFTAYHDAFYRFVEAQSLTPFSGPALDRGLAGTVVAMTRLSDPGMTPPGAVMDIAQHRATADRAVDALADRAAHQPGLAAPDATKTYVAKRGRNVIDAWERVMKVSAEEAAAKRKYSRLERDAPGKALLFTVIDEDQPEENSDAAKFSAPMSMRDVEPSVHVWIERGRLGGRR